jgi:hypothetical protein
VRYRLRRLVGFVVAASVAFFIGISLVAPGAPATAQTNVSGTISSDTTWTAAGSPYVMTDNTTVASGVSLAIEPGAVVQSTGRFRLNVVGVLSAVGTPADPISLSIGSGLRFYAGSLGSEVAWATVRDSIDFGISTELDASNQHGPWPNVHDVEFRSNRFAIYPWYPSQAAASVTNARFIDNDYGIAGVGGTMSFNRVLVQGTGSHSALVSNNSGQNWTISNSNLYAPTQHTGCDANRGCDVYVEGGGYSINATGVWWGTTDPFEVNRRIYDGNDDPARAVVSKDPIATAPHDLYPPSSALAVSNGDSIPADVGSLSGTAADNPTAATGVDQVTVSLQDLSTGQWWNGDNWVATEQFRPATGTTTWQIPIPPLVDGRQYRVRSLARDSSTNMQWGASSATFTADGTPPALPSLSGTSPASPANDNSPQVKGTAEAGSTVKLYTSSSCTGSPAATGSAGDFASPGLTVAVADDSSTSFWATATDQAGNSSGCSSSSVSYTEDSTAPAAPSLTDTDPDSPANDNSPKIKGTAAGGSTVKLYANTFCTGSPAASGSAGDFASPGLAVSVADDSSTSFYATATDEAGNTSGCSTGAITYTEDTPPPPDSDGDGVPNGQDSCPATAANTANGCPAPRPTNPSNPPGDTTPPGCALGGSTKQTLGKSLSISVRATTEDVWATATGTVSVPGAARSYKLGPVKNRFVARGKKVTLKLKLSSRARKAIKRALRTHSTLKAKLTVRLRDGAGNVTTRKRTVKLTR